MKFRTTIRKSKNSNKIYIYRICTKCTHTEMYKHAFIYIAYTPTLSSNFSPSKIFQQSINQTQWKSVCKMGNETHEGN